MVRLDKLGFQASPPDDRDIALNAIAGLPATYSIPRLQVINQGNLPHCVAASFSTILNFIRTTIVDHRALFEKLRGTPEGLIVRDALKILKNEGYIDSYYRLGNENIIKSAILLHGGATIALRVFNDSENFWKASGKLQGGHAVTLVGWSRDSFELLNSWGSSWGSNGRTRFPFSDIKDILEAWSMFVPKK